MKKVKELAHQGDVRRVCVLHRGRAMIDIPMARGATASVNPGLAAPVVSALMEFATLVARCTVDVEKVEEGETETETGDESE